MNVSSFLNGNYLTHQDLRLNVQVWTMSKVDQQLIGDKTKICVTFADFPAKPLALNKTNLRRIVGLYGVEAELWIGKQLRIYRSQTTFAGKGELCVRVCGPDQDPPDPIYDLQGNPVPPAPAVASASGQVSHNAATSELEGTTAKQPVPAPQQPQADNSQATQPPQQSPWDAHPPAIPPNNPPSA